MTTLGFVAEARTGNPAMLQGALTLGGGWIICGLFSLRSDWHGIIGAGVLAMLGAARCLPTLLQIGQSESANIEATAFLISAVVLIAVVRKLKDERARRSRAELVGDDS